MDLIQRFQILTGSAGLARGLHYFQRGTEPEDWVTYKTTKSTSHSLLRCPHIEFAIEGAMFDFLVMTVALVILLAGA